MKKIFLLILIINLFFFLSCSKDHSEPADDLHEITFNVGNFRQQIGSQITGVLNEEDNDVLNDHIGVLNYLIYDSGGKLVRNLKQLSTESNFGTITDRVAAGEYTVVFLGSLKELALSISNGLSKDFFKAVGSDNDIFFSKVNVTVGNSALEHSVVLDRIVSHLQLVIEDELPAEVAKVNLIVYNEYPTFSFASGTIRTEVMEERTISTVISTAEQRTSFKTGLYILNDQLPLTIEIICYNATGQLVKAKKLNSVTCVRNKKTIVSGKLFELPAAGFKISVNSEWDPEPIVIPL